MEQGALKSMAMYMEVQPKNQITSNVVVVDPMQNTRYSNINPAVHQAASRNMQPVSQDQVRLTVGEAPAWNFFSWMDSSRYDKRF